MNKTYTHRLPAITGGAGLDAISTSSSTLVNPDLEEDTLRRRQYRPANQQPLAHDRANVFNGMRPNLYTPEGWLKGENETHLSSFLKSQSPKTEYPDDHRCSDQETASGLCGCNRDASPDSGSSSSPATVSEEEGRRTREHSLYDQQLIAARKRKLMMEKRPQSPDTITVMRAEMQNGLRGSSPQSYSDRIGSQSRDLHSDPVLVPRPASLLPSRSYDDSDHRNDWKTSTPNRRWASSPIPPASHERRRSPSPTSDEMPQSKITLARSASIETSAPPSAARKSISSVFEKLLREEEQRRVEERAKKEAARERRREAKRRKEEEWPRRSDAKADVPAPSGDALEQQAASSDVGLVYNETNRDQDSLPQTSSHLQNDATRLERLARRTPQSSSITRIAPRPSPEKPAASSYKAKLAALRSASIEKEVAATFPIHRPGVTLSSPSGVKEPSMTSNHSSDDSLDSEGDPVTIGSDFQGQAPLQSTPPRNSPSSRSKSLIESPSARLKAPDSSHLEDSIRETVQQLTSVLHEVRDIRGNASAIDQLPLVELKRASEQREMALQTVSIDGRKRVTQIDETYVQKLGQIRERLQEVKSRKPVETIEKASRPSRTRSVLVTVLLQFLFAWLMMLAAEARARQLFLTTYYDPFLPHDLIDFSPVHTNSLFGPLLSKWSTSPSHDFINEETSAYASQTWTQTFSWAAHGPDRLIAVRHLSIRLFTVLGLLSKDSYFIGSFVPT